MNTNKKEEDKPKYIHWEFNQEPKKWKIGKVSDAYYLCQPLYRLRPEFYPPQFTALFIISLN